MSKIKNKFLAQVPANTLKGNNTGSTANVLDLTATQVTAMLNLFSSTLQGLVPLSGGGTTNFLRADGTWAAPTASTATNVSGGSAGSLVFQTAASTTSFISAGTPNQVLQMLGDQANPSWNTVYFGLYPNYIYANPNAEVDTASWATYANTAANIPSNGTGGTATGLTFSRSTSSPLRGTGSFSMVQANSTSLQGKGVSAAFTIDSADQAQVMSISFDYNASTTFVASNGTTPPLNDGTTTTNAGNSDVEVFVYDVTNSVLIPVNPQVITSNGANNFTFNATFQTASNSTSYRLIFHVATANANATGWTFKFDNVYVGRQQTVQGVPATDWTAYTPTLGAGFGTATNVSFFYRRVGDSAEVKGTFTTGTVAASFGSISLPSGLSLDTTKISLSNTTSGVGQHVGYLHQQNSVGLFEIVTATGTSTSVVYSAVQTTGSLPLIPTNFGSNGGSAQSTDVFFNVPIAGWSSNVQMSNAADTRVVAASTNGTPASVTSGNPIIYPTTVFDTHSAYNSSTGRYTVPVSGYYRVTTYVTCSTAALQINVYKNAVSNIDLGNTNSSNFLTASGLVQCVAGDILDIRPNASTGAFSAGGTLYFERLSGPATIAAADTIAAKYYASVNGTASTTQMVNYDTKVYDTTGSVTSAGTGNVNWKFTAPISGKYRITTTLINNAAPGGTVSAAVYKNGSNAECFGFLPSASSVGNFTTTILLLSGDFIDIRANQNNYPWLGASNPQTTFAASPCMIEIERVGN